MFTHHEMGIKEFVNASHLVYDENLIDKLLHDTVK